MHLQQELMKKNTHINIIVAMGKKNQIGLNGTMPWHLSADLKHFKKTTNGHTIIMGRKTFDSIGKALPNRMNFVISSDPKNVNAYEVCSFLSLEKAIEKARLFDDEIYIIGGASIYKQTFHLADKLIITHVDYNGAADTYFPDIDFSAWQKCQEIVFQKDSKNNYDFTIATYLKR